MSTETKCRSHILCTCLFLLYLSQFTKAQVYEDHFGTGNYIGVSVTASDTQNNGEAINTLSGSDLFPSLAGSARFLSQASLGYNWKEIEYVQTKGIVDWLEEQFSMPYTTFYNKYSSVYHYAIDSIGVTKNVHKDEYLTYSFYEKICYEDDALRQKMAFALSQILVVSTNNSNIENNGFGVADYYDILYTNAFGNFNNILEQVSLHPIMGVYLSAFKNAKTDYALGTYPDENYAREIMQLFTIGLYELNNDGSFKKDTNNELIPTYDIVDIQELAKVFTGFGIGARLDTIPKSFNNGVGITDFTVPMKMYENYHDKTPKTLFDGTQLPANQTGLSDFYEVINRLFNHPNVGPFIARRLIQNFVKSNPSPAYVNRVATVFNNNGNNERGDLKAVIKAILLDSEARICNPIDNDVKAGKLIQPIERFTHLFKAFDISSPSGKLFFKDYTVYQDKLGQSFLESPSVFNFFSPFYAENNFVEANDMVSPEFEILTTTSSIHYINLMENAIKYRPFNNQTSLNENTYGLTNNREDDPNLDFSDEIEVLQKLGVEALIERLNILLCRGSLSTSTKATITNTINEYFDRVGTYTNERAVQDAVYFIMISEYPILK